MRLREILANTTFHVLNQLVLKESSVLASANRTSPPGFLPLSWRPSPFLVRIYYRTLRGKAVASQ
uniref:Uncharacterized protein n=1 Tax=Timema poppense TaxID=170557 RepID=A0A7R9H081_TIMPO|nr:unnamed protein product [Timema poppensis]